MSQEPKRLALSMQTMRELCLKSGNLCAYFGCTKLMMTEQGDFIGQVCHIEAAERSGERFNAAMSNEERRSSSNLMLMCYEHHVITNDVQQFPVAVLREMKRQHELRFAGPDRALRERVARLKPAALVAAGIIVDAALTDLLRQLRSMVEFLSRSKSEAHQPANGGANPLRFAPRGTVYYFSADERHLTIGRLLLVEFQDAGWHVERLSAPRPFGGLEGDRFEHSMLMQFAVSTADQLSNAQQAIDLFFEQRGFHKIEDREDVRQLAEERALRFYVPVTVGRGM